MVPGLFIEKAVVPSSGNNLKFFLTYHIVEHIGIYTCRINHVLCMHLTIIRNQPVAEIRFFNLNHFCVHLEFHAVFICIFGHGNGQAEGTYNSAGRRIDSSHHRIADIRLLFPGLVS